MNWIANLSVAFLDGQDVETHLEDQKIPTIRKMEVYQHKKKKNTWGTPLKELVAKDGEILVHQ